MTGGKKARKDIKKGITESTGFTNQAIAQQQPFLDIGGQATNVLAQAAGIAPSGAPAGGQSFLDRFGASPFNAVFTNDFAREKDAIDAGLSDQGLAFSGARLAAVEDARARNFPNALAAFLGNLQGLSNQGFQSAGINSNLLADQGVTTANLRSRQASTRQGFLGGVSQFGNTLQGLSQGLTSFFPKLPGG